MSLIHRTTLSPTKLELLTEWLPRQPWYAGAGGRPELTKAGGFRLDDPQGEVGLEFMVVTDADAAAYHVPLTYRAAPLAAAEHALIGTTEHGVLGTRWVYDGTHDPVLVGQLAAFVRGEAQAQAQSVSDTPDPTVGRSWTGPAQAPAPGSGTVADGPDGTTDVVLGSGPAERLVLRVVRALRPGAGTDAPGGGRLGHVDARWQLPDGAEARAVFVTVHDGTPGA
ncbi:maltokinase N-terminal cap-like domain-containing protein [Streptomyces sp. MI02-7b]|uniref:maltokinase N-terminal cap-like domain-containing protein n=1 Tax=Streptomyces sp. MI02-7b TaxID=462941 RepID=UPI0029AFD266|nr:1,4-alpha-glucan branching protein [Streptomyces sp. MI02-7b]MDX3070978.1 1,4-alpha-glucan branching protein [Streptomyces sp. MI02-7b]